MVVELILGNESLREGRRGSEQKKEWGVLPPYLLEDDDLRIVGAIQ